MNYFTGYWNDNNSFNDNLLQVEIKHSYNTTNNTEVLDYVYSYC